MNKDLLQKQKDIESFLSGETLEKNKIEAGKIRFKALGKMLKILEEYKDFIKYIKANEDIFGIVNFYTPVLTVEYENLSYEYGIELNGSLCEGSGYNGRINLSELYEMAAKSSDYSNVNIKEIDALCFNFDEFKKNLDKILENVFDETLKNITEMKRSEDDALKKLSAFNS